MGHLRLGNKNKRAHGHGMFRAKTATGERRQHTIERYSNTSNKLFICICVFLLLRSTVTADMCDKCGVGFSPGFSEVQSAREAGFDPRIVVIWQRCLDRNFNYGGKILRNNLMIPQTNAACATIPALSSTPCL